MMKSFAFAAIALSATACDLEAYAGCLEYIYPDGVPEDAGCDGMKSTIYCANANECLDDTMKGLCNTLVEVDDSCDVDCNYAAVTSATAALAVAGVAALLQ